MKDRQGRNKTWYINDVISERLEEIKYDNGLSNMNQVFNYLLEAEKELEYLKNEKYNQLKAIDKNIEMILELVTWSAFKTDYIPTFSYKTGLNRAYQDVKAIVEENIEQQTKANREQKMF